MTTDTQELTVRTSRFGPVRVPLGQVYEFPHGLYGFEDQQRFILLPHDDDGVFHWLQAVDDPELAMIVTNPFTFFPDYELVLPDENVTALKARKASDLSVLAILTVQPQSKQVTANLLGPVLINAAARIGMQFALDTDNYATREPLPSKRQAIRAA